MTPQSKEVGAPAAPDPAHDQVPPQVCASVRRMLEALTVHDRSLTIGQLNSLLVVARNPGLTISDLARAAGIPVGTASRHVARLGSPEGLGLLTADISRDARLKPLRLTKRGRMLLRAAARELQ